LSRTIQIGFLISGVTHPTSGGKVAGGTVFFFEAGTTTPKYVYTEKQKTNGYYSYPLDSVGAATLYADGELKIVIKDSNGATVKTYDHMRLRYDVYGVNTVISTPYAMTTDNDLLLVNTTSGDITINALAAASWIRPIKVFRTTGANNIVFTPNGAETVDGNANLTITSDAIVEIVSDGSNLRTVGFRANMADADGDTSVEIERTADIDKAHIKTGGTDRVVVDENGLDIVSGALRIDGADIIDDDGELVDPVLNGDVTGTGVLDEDNMASDSNTKLATQQSIKAYVDAQASATFVNNANGNPNISDTAFLAELFAGIWRSVGPTGGGANSTWTALDGVPAGVDWIEVKLLLNSSSVADTAFVTRTAYVYARKNGSSEAQSDANRIAGGLAMLNNSGYGGVNLTFPQIRIPVASRKFDLYWISTFNSATTVNLLLVGYGYNP